MIRLAHINMKQYKIIDNFFPTQIANEIENSIVKENIMNVYDLPVNVPQYTNINTDMFQETKSYTRMLMLKNEVQYEPAKEIIKKLLQNLQLILNTRFVVSSVRVNYMNEKCTSPTLKYDIPHADIKQISKNMYTIIYYVNDSHGDTILYNETVEGSMFLDNASKNLTCLEKINPKKNRLLIFNANQLHSAPSYCTEDRYVINLNITTEYSITL